MSSLSKVLITGKVVRSPEKRFTNNNLAITTFTIDIGTTGEEKLLRVVAIGRSAEMAADNVKKDQRVAVDGRLQTNTVKTESGVEKKIVEVSAQNIEIIEGASQQAGSEPEGIDTDFDLSEEISDDLIGEDEIPF